MMRCNGSLQFWTNASTILASLVAIGAFVTSFWFFRETAELQTDANAVNIMNEHIKLFIENPELHKCDQAISSSSTATNENAHSQLLTLRGQCTDAAEHAAFTAETIYGLAPDDEAWVATVRGMISDNRWWYESPAFRAARYDKAFVTLVRAELANASD